jgi:hypothetical protein
MLSRCILITCTKHKVPYSLHLPLIFNNEANILLKVIPTREKYKYEEYFPFFCLPRHMNNTILNVKVKLRSDNHGIEPKRNKKIQPAARAPGHGS